MATATKGWFVDPVGRFDGRLFDGRVWTAQVSQNGSLVIDPDWVVPEEATNHSVSADVDVEPAVDVVAETMADVDVEPAVDVVAETMADVDVEPAVDVVAETIADRDVATLGQVAAAGGLVIVDRRATERGSARSQERRGGSDRRQVNIEVAVDRRRGDRRVSIQIPSADD